MVGKTLGQRYKIVEEIGDGGMGTVYRATHLHLKQDVALKVLPLYSDDTLKRRFMNEALKAMACRHGNVVGVYDYVEEKNGVHFLVMEFVPGQNLTTFIESHEGKVPLTETVELVSQVCRGLEEIHRHQIVHRDLKPENIQIQRSEEGQLRAVIIDFGIARAEGDLKLTDHGSLIGTYAYMSPEQIEGHDIDTRSDIYSLGVLIYYLLAGNPPFQATKMEGYISAHLTQQPPPLKKKRKGLPRKFQKIISKALAKKADDRYQTIGAFLNDFIDAATPNLNPFYKTFAFWQSVGIVAIASMLWVFRTPVLEGIGYQQMYPEAIVQSRLDGDASFFTGAYASALEHYTAAEKELVSAGFQKDHTFAYLQSQIQKAELLQAGQARAGELQSSVMTLTLAGDRALEAGDHQTAVGKYKEAMALLPTSATMRAQMGAADSLQEAGAFLQARSIYNSLLSPGLDASYPLVKLMQVMDEMLKPAADSSLVGVEVSVD